MIIAKSMETEPPISKLKLMIVGKEKSGKSWLAASGRKPVLVHDHDCRSESLSGKKDTHVLSYVDGQWPNVPEAAQDQMDIIDQLERDLDISKLKLKGRSVWEGNPNPPPPGTLVKTNVIDSLATLGRNAQNYALNNSKDIRREISFGRMKVYLPGGWDAWNAEMKSVEPIILRFLALPCDTIVIFHEMMEQAEDSTDENPRYTGQIGVHPARYRSLVKYFNEVWRVKLVQNGTYMKPKAFPLPTWDFTSGASAMLLDLQEDPNIETMIAKHEARLADGGQPQLGYEAPQLPSKVII